MLHPDTELRFINEIMGYGVFATRLIPAGTITWVRDELDQSFSVEEVARMPAEYQKIIDKYSFMDAQGRLVLCWDHARYFNHSCEANCLSAGYDFELTVRPIQPGEELTDDYATLNLRQPFVCGCQRQTCRKVILPDDFERLSPLYDQLVGDVFPLMTSVPQPLWTFVKEKPEVESVLLQRSAPRSIRFNYIGGPYTGMQTGAPLGSQPPELNEQRL